MVRRPDYSSFLALAAPLALASLLAGCGDQSPSPLPSATTTATTTAETTTVDAETALSIEECVERFSEGSAAWGDNPVMASFSYDLAALTDAQIEELIASLREREGTSHLIFNTGSSAPIAAEEFLASEQQQDAEFFQAGAIKLLRVRRAEAAPFETALREGCEGAPQGATIRQVTFSQGNQ